MWWAYTRGGLYSGGLIVGGLRYPLQVYVPQNTTQIYMFHIFCQMYITWPVNIF